jgi:hypothetical protein
VAADATLTKVKTDLRISHNSLDDDIRDQIDACLGDLKICGIQEPSETDTTILCAIKLWCRAAYTDDTGDSKAYRDAYEAMKGTLMMATGYGGEPDV